MPDVLVLTMPLSRFAEVAEMVGVMYDPNLRGSLEEPPPQRVISANLLDHMVCEGLLRDLDAIMADTRRPGNVATLVNAVADAMERAAGILRGRLGALALFVSPPGFMYWQQICNNSFISCWKCARHAGLTLLSAHRTFGLTMETCALTCCRTQPSSLRYPEC